MYSIDKGVNLMKVLFATTNPAKVKLYKEKYSETIGALSDDSFGNRKKK